MLRPYLFLFVVLLLPAGCKDKDAPKPSVITQTAPRTSPEVLEAQAQQQAEALQKAGVSPERSKALRAEIVKQAPRNGFSISEDEQFVLGFSQEGMPITGVMLEIELAKPVPEDAGDAVRAYFTRAKQILEEQRKREAE